MNCYHFKKYFLIVPKLHYSSIRVDEESSNVPIFNNAIPLIFSRGNSLFFSADAGALCSNFGKDATEPMGSLSSSFMTPSPLNNESPPLVYPNVELKLIVDSWGEVGGRRRADAGMTDLVIRFFRACGRRLLSVFVAMTLLICDAIKSEQQLSRRSDFTSTARFNTFATFSGVSVSPI